MKLNPRPQVPTEHRIVNGTHGRHAEPVYPPHEKGRALYVIRLHFDMDLRATARLLGLRPVDVSDLENGRATLTDAEWTHVFRALAALPPRSMLLPGEEKSS